jgi:hypothetical protein
MNSQIVEYGDNPNKINLASIELPKIMKIDDEDDITVILVNLGKGKYYFGHVAIANLADLEVCGTLQIHLPFEMTTDEFDVNCEIKPKESPYADEDGRLKTVRQYSIDIPMHRVVDFTDSIHRSLTEKWVAEYNSYVGARQHD